MAMTESPLAADPTALPAAIGERAARVRLACFDVDGVLTNGQLWFAEDGRELKAFHVHDGLGLKRLAAHGIAVAWISARSSPLVAARARELGIVHVFQAAADKLAVFDRLLTTLALSPAQAAYVGDDLPDLPVLQRAGLAIAVANAQSPVKQAAHWVSRLSGGSGAVREICEWILAAQGADVGADAERVAR